MTYTPADNDNSLKAINDYLQSLQSIDSDAIDLCEATIKLAGINHPKRSLERYYNHIENISQDVKSRHDALIKAGADDDAGCRLAALKHAIHDERQYKAVLPSSQFSFDHADLIETIENRKGLPITLGIIYLCAAQKIGWDMTGLNFPSHFLLRIDHESQRIIFNPATPDQPMQAVQMRQLAKEYLGEKAELSSHFYAPITKREVLIRLKNIIKLKAISAGDYDKAIQIIETMRHIDPSEYRLLLDAGVLYARLNQVEKAIKMLEEYVQICPDPQDRFEARLIIDHLNTL